MQKALGHTVIIEFSHYAGRKLLFWWFKSGVFEPHFGGYSRCERRYPYIKGCNSGASQKILWKQVVTCSAHSKEHFKTNLAEYWGGGCTVGRVTSRTIGTAAMAKVLHCPRGYSDVRIRLLRTQHRQLSGNGRIGKMNVMTGITWGFNAFGRLVGPFGVWLGFPCGIANMRGRTRKKERGKNAGCKNRKNQEKTFGVEDLNELKNWAEYA